MIRVLLNGINGHMGKAMLHTLPEWSEEIIIVAGVDLNTYSEEIPVFSDVAEVEIPFDVALDFSVPAATMKLIDYCVEHKKAVVIGTTGLNEEHLLSIKKASSFIPVFRSGNMSLGINLMQMLVKQAKQTLGDRFDVEIIETHHNRKIDAPSGTAKMLVETIKSASDQSLKCVYGRKETNHRREKDEIGIHSLRGGTITGEHEVIFLGDDESISIKHRAFSKDVFANGAYQAVKFILEKEPGMYQMDDLLKELL